MSINQDATDIPIPTLVPTPSVTATPVPTPPSTPMSTQTPERTDSSIDRTVRPTLDDEWISNLEQLIHEFTNKERLKHNLPALEYDPVIANIARLHSQDMAELDYFAHDNLRGEGPSDRANKAGFKGCKINGWIHSGLAENIAQNWLFSDVSTGDWNPKTYTRDKIFEYHLPSELASEIVQQWMTSQGHMENILTIDYASEGLGVSIDDENKVYATQNFSRCTPN